MHSSWQANTQSASTLRRARSLRYYRHALVIACGLSTGCCSTGYLTLRTLVTEPSKYCFKIDKLRSLSVYHKWAAQEWERAVRSSPDTPISPSYEAGFIDGFVDYVYAGGTGEPPPVPPRQFWNVEGRSLDGKAAANQWFAGFRHGSRVAAEGGYRVLATLHTSLGGDSDYSPGAVDSVPDSFPVGDPAAETLPSPPVTTPTIEPPTETPESNPTARQQGQLQDRPSDSPSSSPLPKSPPESPATAVDPTFQPKEMPLDASPTGTEPAALPAGDGFVPDENQGDSSSAPPEVVNPFRTASSEAPITPAVTVSEEEKVSLPLPPLNPPDELAPAPLTLPPETIRKPAAVVQIAPKPADLPLQPPTNSNKVANTNWVNPVRRHLSKADLVKLTAPPVDLEQPADPVTEVEVAPVIDRVIIAPVIEKQADRTSREKYRAGYFEK